MQYGYVACVFLFACMVLFKTKVPNFIPSLYIKGIVSLNLKYFSVPHVRTERVLFHFRSLLCSGPSGQVPVYGNLCASLYFAHSQLQHDKT